MFPKTGDIYINGLGKGFSYYPLYSLFLFFHSKYSRLLYVDSLPTPPHPNSYRPLAFSELPGYNYIMVSPQEGSAPPKEDTSAHQVEGLAPGNPEGGGAVVTTHDQRRVVIELFARGYTIRKVRKELASLYGRTPSDSELMRLAAYYSDDIVQAQEDLAEMALRRGLAMKEERIHRLAEIQETFHDKALSGDHKSANIAMKAIKQVQEEVEPLGLQLLLPPGDPWGALIQDLVELAQNPQQLPRAAYMLTTNTAKKSGEPGKNSESDTQT